MEQEAEDNISTNRWSSRKRKEEKLSNSDSEPFHSVRRRKKQPHPPCSSDEECCNSTKTQISPVEELIDFCRNLSGNISSRDIKYIQKKTTECSKHIRSVEEENSMLKTQVERCGNISIINKEIEKLSKTITGVVEKITERDSNVPKSPVTYAEMAKMRKNLVQQHTTRSPKHVLTVFPQEKCKIQNSEETKKENY